MKNAAKMIVVCVFALAALFVALSSVDVASVGSSVLAQVAPTATPPANKPVNAAPANANAGLPANTAPAAGDKKIPKSFTLGKDSLSEYGEAPFDHDTHAFKSYSPDGKSVIGCVECHHTDQPKSALKPPLVTSERDAVLTNDVFQKSSQKVSTCRSCHFQEGSVPDGKVMPTAGGKDLNNELAYHINCNTCHDAAFKARPDLKGKKGFATSKDCLVCHTKN
jgi:hypothetical protein